jgi:hypothetical protein
MLLRGGPVRGLQFSGNQRVFVLLMCKCQSVFAQIMGVMRRTQGTLAAPGIWQLPLGTAHGPFLQIHAAHTSVLYGEVVACDGGVQPRVLSPQRHQGHSRVELQPSATKAQMFGPSLL